MRYVIIGNSAAAVGAVESIRKVDRAGDVVLIGDEPHHVYSRPMIAHFVAGEIGEDRLSYRPVDFYRQMNVQVKSGHKATGIDFIKQKVLLADKEQVVYDRLLICTGSSVTKPSLKNIELEGVTTFQKLADTYYIKERLASGVPRAVVIGGGFIGLRAAQSLREAGLNVVMLVRSRVMRRVLDVESSALAESLLQREGIEIIKSRTVREIKGVNGRAAAVMLDNGSEVPCSLVVVATGVAPNLKLIENSGGIAGRGIAVNEYMQTTYSNVFAAGDVTETYDISRERSFNNANWPNAHEQGGIAGLNMAGKRVPYRGSISMNVISIRGIPIVCIGITDPEAENDGLAYEIKVKKVIRHNIYQKLVFKDNRLKGAIFVGDLGYCGAIKDLIREQTPVGIIKNSILNEGYQLYGFLRKKRQTKLEGNTTQWPESYMSQTPYRKGFNEKSWTERERGQRKWRNQELIK